MPGGGAAGLAPGRKDWTAAHVAASLCPGSRTALITGPVQARPQRPMAVSKRVKPVWPCGSAVFWLVTDRR